MAGVIEIYSKFEVPPCGQTFLKAERVSQSETHRRSVSVYGQNFFSRKEGSVWCNKFEDDRKALNDKPEEHRQGTWLLDENCVIDQGILREDGIAKFRERRC
jgi:hypothetical protein